MILRRLTTHVNDQNWFAVALDFFIVVMGVGVAMMGQQVLSERQQKADLALAETALQSDLFSNYVVAKERVAVSGCRIDTYQAIAAKLRESGDQWTGMPRAPDDTVFKTALPTLLRSPNRPWGSATWDAEMLRGTFNYMEDSRRSAFIDIFGQADAAEILQEEIFTLQGRIKTLASSFRLSQSDRLRYYDVLAELDDKSALLELIAAQIISAIEGVGITFPPGMRAEILPQLAVRHEAGKAVYGDCLEMSEWPVLDPPTDGGDMP